MDSLDGWSRDLLPSFRTSPSMISDEGKGKGYVEEQGEDNRCRQAWLLKKSRFVKTASVPEAALQHYAARIQDG